MRYLPDHRLPDKALDLIDQACAAKIIQTLSPPDHDKEGDLGRLPRGAGRITGEDVARVISARCQIPVGVIAVDDSARLLQMEEVLSRRVIGQEAAIKQVADAIRTARVGLKRPNRPLGVFLFLGSTGTGKTELAKATAEFLFGSEEALIRFDMSEYGEKHTVSRLIGAPPGYIGHEEEGQLTGKVRTRPYSVVLFDEIEKAHPEVFDIFLQIFDDGRLTDSKGRRTMFTECIIILTSNLGFSRDAKSPGRAIGFRQGAGSEAGQAERAEYERNLRDAVSQAFKPELLNRIGHQVIFYRLSKQAIVQILDKLIRQLNGLLANKTITLAFSDEAKAFLIEEGYSEQYGARELERVFERRVATPMAREILEQRVVPGSRVYVNVRGDEICFE
jgi:ATP-dependent Clp protease ATP-binding subunit ClpC